jgi:hypothetical protein
VVVAEAVVAGVAAARVAVAPVRAEPEVRLLEAVAPAWV